MRLLLTVHHSHCLIVCSMFLSVGDEYVTIKSWSIAKEMTTGTIGTTVAKKIEVHKTMYRKQHLVVHGHWKSNVLIFWELTPTDQWDSNNVSGADVDKHNYQFLVHVYSQWPYSHPCHQCKVVDQSWHIVTQTSYTCVRLIPLAKTIGIKNRDT